MTCQSCLKLSEILKWKKWFYTKHPLTESENQQWEDWTEGGKDHLNSRAAEQSWEQSRAGRQRDAGESHEEGNERNKRKNRRRKTWENPLFYGWPSIKQRTNQGLEAGDKVGGRTWRGTWIHEGGWRLGPSPSRSSSGGRGGDCRHWPDVSERHGRGLGVARV